MSFYHYIFSDHYLCLAQYADPITEENDPQAGPVNHDTYERGNPAYTVSLNLPMVARSRCLSFSYYAHAVGLYTIFLIIYDHQAEELWTKQVSRCKICYLDLFFIKL